MPVLGAGKRVPGTWVPRAPGAGAGYRCGCQRVYGMVSGDQVLKLQ